MTVNELIERLRIYDGNLKVVYSDVQADSPDVEIKDVSSGASEENGESLIYLWNA